MTHSPNASFLLPKLPSLPSSPQRSFIEGTGILIGLNCEGLRLLIGDVQRRGDESLI